MTSLPKLIPPPPHDLLLFAAGLVLGTTLSALVVVIARLYCNLPVGV